MRSKRWGNHPDSPGMSVQGLLDPPRRNEDVRKKKKEKVPIVKALCQRSQPTITVLKEVYDISIPQTINSAAADF
jgi:hypothetical protein